MKIRLDWIDTKSARRAVHRWHYSRRMPVFKINTIGLWENNEFIGTIIFGQGATPEIGKSFGMKRTEVCELLRVAISDHATETSKFIAISLRMVKKKNPNLRIVISFADSRQGHIGTIYQASNWFYLGESTTHEFIVGGERIHPKTLHTRYGLGGQSIPWLRSNVDPQAKRITSPPKYKYAFGLDKQARSKLATMANSYPKRTPDRGAIETINGRRCEPDPYAPS